jgi:hypothetical protein
MKCEQCEDQEEQSVSSTDTQMQRQEFSATPPADDDDDTGNTVQTQLKIGAAKDAFEQEADAVADKVVQRLSISPSTYTASAYNAQAKLQLQSQTQADEDLIQTKRGDSSGSSVALEQQLSSSGNGDALSSGVRGQMEDAFGVDFSAVRVHTDSQSQQMNDNLNARAFTYGTDIHFNTGEYQPGNREGQHLLAHELTHVVQQNGGLQRQDKEETSAPIADVQTKRIQRDFVGTLSFGPRNGVPKGALIHKETLPLFAQSINPDLFIEARIPGANKQDVDTGKWGVADFYRGKPSDRTIGIKFIKASGGKNDEEVEAPSDDTTTAAPEPGTPMPLDADGKLQFGGGAYKHGGSSAPRGFAANPKIRRIDIAPTSVELGDLKPAHSGEVYFGTSQLSNYRRGISNTATLTNDYLRANSSTEHWNVTPANMSTLTIPPKVKTPSTSGMAPGPLTVWANGKKRVIDTDMTGSMVVYKSDTSGIWAYEWVPISIPATTGSGDVNIVLTRLRTDVIDKITDTGKKSGALKAKSTAPLKPKNKKVTAKHTKVLRRKNFDYTGWKAAYGGWKTSAGKFLGDKDEKKKLAVLETIEGANKRTGVGATIPADVKERIKGAEQIKHWNRLGGLYGWLRNTFDGVYVKLADFAKKVKKKIQGFLKSAGSSGFGNWIKAAAKAIFKVFKFIGSWTINQVLDKLLNSLQEGISNNLKKLVESITPEGVKSKIEEIEALKANYETILKESQENLEKRLFGDKLEMFSKLDEFMAIANTVSTIVSVVRWGIRIVACASPPLLGCLWNLAIAALEFAFAKLMETCWFSAKTFKWIKDYNISTVLNFPTTVASYVVTKANEAIPLPEGVDPLFAPITINKDDFNIDCSGSGGGEGGGGGSGPTPEQEALMQLVQDIGEDKFNAMLELLLKRGAGPHVQLTAERLAELKPLLDKLSADQLRKLAEGQASDKTVGLEEFLKTIATYSAEEKAAIDARKLDYDKAKRSNPSYQKSIGWKPELFVDHGIAPDSAEFADAIYDIQVILGFKKPDGMMGPNTLVTFYNKNGIKQDSAYKNAMAEIELAKLSKEIAKELAVPYPDKSQLIKDLSAIDWSAIGDNGVQLFDVGGNKVIAARTHGGARMGGYYKTIKTEFKGKPTNKIIDVQFMVNIDSIANEDWFSTAMIRYRKAGGEMELTIVSFTDKPVHSELSFGSLFHGLMVN